MPFSESVILIVFIVVAIVGAIIWHSYRSREFQKLARKLGLKYDAKAGRTFFELFDSKWLFPGSRTSTVAFQLRGYRNGVKIRIFDYSERKSLTQTVVLLESKRLNLPAYRVDRETLGQRIVDDIFECDIDPPGHPEFSKQFRLTAQDEKAVLNLFANELCDFFVRRQNICSSGHGKCLFIYCEVSRTSQIVSGDKIPEMLNTAFDLFDLLASDEQNVEDVN